MLPLRPENAPPARRRQFRVLTEECLVECDLTGCITRCWASFWGHLAAWLNGYQAMHAAPWFLHDGRILIIRSGGEERWVQIIRAPSGEWRFVTLDAEYHSVHEAACACAMGNGFVPELEEELQQWDRSVSERAAAVLRDPDWVWTLMDAERSA